MNNTFHCFDWFAEDLNYSSYTIYGFGLSKEGKSIAIHITGFEPFFYISVPDTWTFIEYANFIEDIEKDTSLGITHVFNRGFLHSWIRTPLGGFYNHSATPNCILVDGYVGEEFVSIKKLVTLKNISAGDEITCIYTLYSI